MKIESKELRAFHAVVEEGGFNRASNRLHLSQSAVSQSVANLEQKLQVPLILRGKSLSLTEAGKRIFDYACEVLREEQSALEDLQRIRHGESATLSLAMNAQLTRYYGPGLVGQYCEQHPHLQLKVNELPSRRIIYAVLAGKTELGLGPFQKHMSAFDTVPLGTETRLLVIGRAHREAKAIAAGNARAMRNTALITSFLDDASMRPSIERIRDKFARVWQVDSLELRVRLVAQGLGATYLDQRMVWELSNRTELIPVTNIAFGSIERTLGLYYKTGKTLSESAQGFVGHCQAYWQQLEDRERVC